MTDLALTSSPLEDRITYAKALAASDLLPSSYRGKPANVLIALELGAALGIAPTTALYGINVIQGKPTLSAETMRAVVLAHGHRFEVIAFTDTEAAVRVARKERPQDTSDFAFTIEDARRAGLVGGNYEKFPKAMLLARVTTAACRAVFPDVLAGVSYAPEELEPAPTLVETDRPRAIDRILTTDPTDEDWQDLARDLTPPEADVVDAVVVEDAPEPAPRSPEPTTDEVYLHTLVTRATNLMKAAGHTTKAHRLAYVATVLGVDVSEVNAATMTAGDWEAVIAALTLAEDAVPLEPEADVDEQALAFEEGR